MIALAEQAGIELFHTPAAVAHGAISVGSHRETWRVRSPQVELWLRRLHYEQSGEAVPGGVVSEAVASRP